MSSQSYTKPGNMHPHKHFCSVCGKGFQRSNRRNDHERTHQPKENRDYRHRCPHCNKGFNQKEDVARHVRSKHENAKFKCKGCLKEIQSRKDAWIRHLRTENAQRYGCAAQGYVKVDSGSNTISGVEGIQAEQTGLHTRHQPTPNYMPPHASAQMVPGNFYGDPYGLMPAPMPPAYSQYPVYSGGVGDYDPYAPPMNLGMPAYPPGNLYQPLSQNQYYQPPVNQAAQRSSMHAQGNTANLERRPEPGQRSRHKNDDYRRSATPGRSSAPEPPRDRSIRSKSRSRTAKSRTRSRSAGGRRNRRSPSFEDSYAPQPSFFDDAMAYY